VPGSPWTADYSDIWPSVEPHIDAAMAMSPSNTATSYDGMSYPFLRFWFCKARASFIGCIEQAIWHGNKDWYQADVVLIRKAAKPRYNVVKGWRMIYLLPVMARVTDRMVLLEVAKHLELEDTQFGSRRKRGCHDTCAVLSEFLKANSGFCTALLSMNIEGGFDRIDMDLMADFLVARGCPNMFVNWIQHWAGQRRIRFSFNDGLSCM